MKPITPNKSVIRNSFFWDSEYYFKYYTLPWVEYLSFQGYRTIVRINIFEYIKYVHRSKQLDLLLK